MGYVSHKLLGVDTTAVTTTQEHELGTIVWDQAGREFVYVVADGTGVAAGDTVKLATGYVVTSGSAGTWVFAVAPVAIGASKYGWVQTRGVCTAKVATSTAAQALLGLLSAASSKLTALSAVAEGGSTSHSAGAHVLRAVALSAESGGTSSVLLR